MIIVYHHKSKVSRIHDTENDRDLNISAENIAGHLFKMAFANPEKLIVWCEQSYKDALNFKAFADIFHHRKIMASYNPSNENYLPNAIGYVEESVFLKIKKEVSYPTWQMSSCVGGIHASLLMLFENHVKKDHDFDYFLNSLAKLAMPLGLFCYSEPDLLTGKILSSSKQANIPTLFRFVKQHYKSVWIFFLFLDLGIYEKKFPLWSFVKSCFYKRRKLPEFILTKVPIVSLRQIQRSQSLDVIIPTIGRKSYLHNIVKDFSMQTLLPKTVIIVEQNPLPDSTSELDFITSENWPFEIKHVFTHKTGACNARNVALAQVKNDWVFLADDDIRLEKNFLELAFKKMYALGGEVYNFCCINPGEQRKYDIIHQTSIFGGGCSIISRESLGSSTFDTSYEFGFGEDNDFGMQLMNKGYEVDYLPEPVISHTKAPVGGFRTKPKLRWESDTIKPKPSPTVLLFKLRHHTIEQLNGYKTVLFFKYYRLQQVKNPFKYYSLFKQQWNKSVYWANELLKETK